MIGAMIIQGITHGAERGHRRSGPVLGLIVSMWVGNLMLVLLNLPLIGMAAELVLVLLVDARNIGGGTTDRPGEELAAHLRRHGVNAEVRQVPSGGASVPDTLLAQTRNEGVDLLVMGGYGHSRLREMLIGGATRHILEHMTVPVLLAH